MKPQEAVIRETRHIAIGTVLMTAIMLIVFALLRAFSLAVLLGALCGCVLAIANFFLLGVSVQKIAETSDAENPDNVKLAKLQMRKNYSLRMLLGAGLLILAIVVCKLNWIACCLPLIFPRITIGAMDVYKRVRTIKGSDIK